jgi:predicted transcriptional regulator
VTQDALIVMAWLASHPGSDANTLGRLVTNGGSPQRVSNAGWRIASELRRSGLVEVTHEPNRNQRRLLYSLTPKGRRLLKES